MAQLQDRFMIMMMTEKDLCIRVDVLYTQTYLRYRLLDKEESNIHAYLLCFLHFQTPIQIICKYI